MPIVKLSPERVVEIKNRLKKGEYHHLIAQDFNISRQTVTKINKSLKCPFHRDARWSHVSELDTYAIDEVHIPKSMREIFNTLNSEAAGVLIKNIIKEKEKRCDGRI
jgi:hypothetical protein